MQTKAEAAAVSDETPLPPAMPPRRCDPGNTPGGESKEQTARLREANAHSRLAGRWRGSGRWGRMVVRLVHHT